MNNVRSADAEITYELEGKGAPVVLLHPFPVNHEFWQPVVQALNSRYQLVLLDLRGHGSSEIGEGPALMEKHAADIARVMDDAGVGRAAMVGVSIGGYALFEFWRRYRGRAAALILIDTKATADTPEARNARLQVANDVMERGTEAFIDGMLPRLMGETTRKTRPDLVETARKMMLKMSPEDIGQVQRGMAARPDSVETLKTINVPTLIVAGDEDTLTPIPDAELMRQHIGGSQLQVVPKAGHYSPFERPDESGRMLRQFLDSVHGG
ncbi:MAG TPA: alpha/beta fold hydrolase [Terriglobales bacterium]|jgi:pimeloyl-ACP methyl ester carboxylesterase|nr:alpha/beta fold hydrolase [Terriglobales bacterium]